MKRFSITIPAYKKRFLHKAIESCLTQTYKDFELIIVDDASPEDLKSVIANFQDERIRYYRNEKNCGAERVTDNWNKCLSYAEGEYIICMGDDDILKNNCLEEYDKLIRLYPKLDVYHAWTELIDENGEVVGMQEPRPIYESALSMLYNRFRFDRLQYIGDWLFNVQNLKQNGGFYYLPFAWGSDDMTAFVTAKNNGIANSQIPLFQYRVSTLTISSGGHDEQKILALRQMDKDLMKMLGELKISNYTDEIYIKLLKPYIHRYIQNRIYGHLINYFKLQWNFYKFIRSCNMWTGYLSFPQVCIAYFKGITRKIKSMV